jgi:Trk-type K+ transport system membrane component
MLEAALRIAWKVVLVYVMVFHVVGVLLLFGALHIKPHNPELVGRGFSRFVDSVFTTVSAFANAGFMLSSDNAAYLKTNPAAYCWICVLILVGATAAPLILRIMLAGLQKVRWRHLGLLCNACDCLCIGCDQSMCEEAWRSRKPGLRAHAHSLASFGRAL